MATKMDIINMALANIGHDAIATVNDDQKDANEMRIHYDTALADVLRSHPWGFAMRRAGLAELPQTPIGFDHAYAYPVDCIMARRVMGDRWSWIRAVPFEIGRSIDGRQKAVLTNCPPVVVLEYTSSLVQPSEFDPQFITALSWRLAAAVTMGVHGDPQAHQAAMQSYYGALQLAMADDGRETASPRLPDGDFLLSRRC